MYDKNSTCYHYYQYTNELNLKQRKQMQQVSGVAQLTELLGEEGGPFREPFKLTVLAKDWSTIIGDYQLVQ